MPNFALGLGHTFSGVQMPAVLAVLPMAIETLGREDGLSHS